MSKKNNATFLFLSLTCFGYFVIHESFAKEMREGISFIQLPSDIPMIEPSEMPDQLILSKVSADDDAKNKIKVADQLRKNLTNLTFSGAIKDAYTLYEAAANSADVSPDVRGRAKINVAELYPYANTDDSSYASIQQRKVESFKLFNDVIEGEAYSGDLRAWAKCIVAKLYLENAFDVEFAAAKQKALALWQEVVAADKGVSADTKARAKVQMAKAYSKMKFDVPAADARQKADSLYNEVKKDPQIALVIKADAAFGLASIRNSDDDPYNTQRLKLLKDISTEAMYTASIQAKAKAIIARGLLKGEFDAKGSEASTMAIALYKEIIADPKPDAKSTEKLTSAERFTYKQEIAEKFANNAFHQKSKEAKEAAQALYKELLTDVSAYTDQKIAVKWQLALHYLEKRLDPPAGKDAKTAGIDLINEITAEKHVGFELLFIIKLNYARLHHFSIVNNPLGLTTSQAKDDAFQILNELLNDSRLSGKQKEMVQSEIDMWNGVAKR
jgi:hypothetical protein